MGETKMQTYSRIDQKEVPFLQTIYALVAEKQFSPASFKEVLQRFEKKAKRNT